MGLPLRLELYLLYFLVASQLGHDNSNNMSNNETTYRKYEHTQFHSGMGTQTHCMCMNFPFIESILIRVVPNNLASHARYTA